MKIRHKNIAQFAHLEPPVLHDVVDESPDWYITNVLTGGFRCALPKRDWEPVPQPTWRDVTAECEQVNTSLIHRSPGITVQMAFGIMDGYRLTKISGPLTPHVAFIVEKKE